MRKSLAMWPLMLAVVLTTGCASDEPMKVEKLGEVKSIDQVSEAFTLVTNQNCDQNLLSRDNYVQQSCDRASILVQTNDHKTLERIRLELLINKEDFNSVLVGDNWLIETSSNNASALERDLGGRIYD